MTDQSQVSLPKGWVDAELAELFPFPKVEIVDGPFGSNLKATEYRTSGVPIIRLQNVDHYSFIEKNIKFISPEKAQELKRHSFAPGDIVITKLGAPLGKAAIVPNAFGSGIIVADVVRCRVNERHASRKYLMLAINSPYVAERLALDTKGTTRPRVNLKHIRSLRLPVAPRSEQDRIVEKVEMLFAQLDKGEEALRVVQKQLNRYRQSILKAAFTGQYTANWRTENAHQLESGADLLARLLDMRRQTWDGRGKYREPDAPSAADLFELPKGWAAARFEQLFQVYGGATPSRAHSEYWGGDVPWVSSGEVAFCRIRDTSEKITQAGYASCSTKIHPPGTVLLAMIGEGKTRGQAAILEIEACNNQNAAAIRVSGTGIPPQYLYFFLMGNYEHSRSKGQGGNQPALNGEKVKGFVLPLPSIEEMNEIVSRVEAAFTTADVVEKWCETELARSAALRQSILKEAFSGRLVPQDPTDEPAADLLARIKAGSAAKQERRGRRP